MEPFSEYFKKDNVILRVDARVKILVGIAVLGMLLSYEGYVLPLFVIALCLFYCIRTKIPLRVFILRFSEPVFIASVVLLLKTFFSGDDVLFNMNVLGVKVVMHKDGFFEGLMIACRILGAVSIIAVMGFSMPFTEFIAGLSYLKIPKILIEVLMFAYRYIFVLLEDAMIIYNAQKNRLGYSNIRSGLISFGTLSGSLMLKAFEHSHKITVSMIQRGYDGNMPMLKHKPFKPSEVIVAVLFILAVGFVWKI